MSDTPVHRSGLSAEDYKRVTGFDGDWRDTWWDDDYLAMMGRKWRLQDVHHALDVGCGVGHWGQRLMRHMDESSHMVGIDAEPGWVKGSQERAERLGLEERARYQVAHAESLPFEDGTFDMVTCQTVLMHVPDPDRVVAEMIRVLGPGGLFVAAEPNNFGSSAAQLIGQQSLSWADLSPLLELEYVAALGKDALGEGFYSVGERLPRCLHAAGWTDVHVHQNNQCAPKIPPYADLCARMDVERMRDAHAAGTVMAAGGTPEAVRRFYLAGGGDEDRLQVLVAHMRAHEARILAAIDAGEHVTGGGHIHYLVWGHKPG